VAAEVRTTARRCHAGGVWTLRAATAVSSTRRGRAAASRWSAVARPVLSVVASTVLTCCDRREHRVSAVQVDYTYLMGSDETSLAKIGHSVMPWERLKQLRTGSPYRLRMLWWHGGGLRLERALHRKFAGRHRSGEWFDFDGLDPVAAVSAATVEVFESGAVDGRRRLPRVPTVIGLNGTLIAFSAPVKSIPDADGTYRQQTWADGAWAAQCTAADGSGIRCPAPLVKHDFEAWKAGVRRPRDAAVEIPTGWVVCPYLQLDHDELDRWLRQRCPDHAGQKWQMWCAPEWEPFVPARHVNIVVREEKPEGDCWGEPYEVCPLKR
jgi:hypothetical protein